MSKFITCIESDSFMTTKIELDFALEQIDAPVEEGFGDKIKEYAKIAYDKFMELIKIVSEAIDRAIANIKKYFTLKLNLEVDVSKAQLWFNSFTLANQVEQLVQIASQDISNVINHINRKSDDSDYEGEEFQTKLFFALNKIKKAPVGKKVKYNDIKNALSKHNEAINTLSKKFASAKDTLSADENAKILKIPMNQIGRMLNMLRADVNTLSGYVAPKEA